MLNTRPQFQHESLLKQAREVFQKSKSENRFYKISDSDCLMSCLAVFSQKCSSLLQFDNNHKDNIVFRNNLHTLYGINRIPSDTQMRERLDEMSLHLVRD